MSTVLGPLSDIRDWVKGHNFLAYFIGVKKHRLSFITIHCTLKPWSKSQFRMADADVHVS